MKSPCLLNPARDSHYKDNISVRPCENLTTDENDFSDEQLPLKFVLKDAAARCLAIKCKSGTGSLQQADSTLVEFIVDDI